MTIVEMVRSMLLELDMLKKFWVDAVACATYVLNKCPTKSIPKKTPEEAWSGKKPLISHLRVFESLAYVNILKQ